MSRAGRLLAEYPRELEADLQRYCATDLRDLWRPGGGASRLTYRRLLVLIDHALPGESATKTAIRDGIADDQLVAMAKQDRDGHGPWSHEALLQAAGIDVLRTILYVLIVANGGKSQPPTPMPRPGVAARRRRALSPEGHAYLMKLRREHAELHGYTEGSTTEDGSTEAG